MQHGPRDQERRTPRDGPAAWPGSQAGLRVESEREPGWMAVLEGRSELGLGSLEAPPDLGAALAHGPDTCEASADGSPAALAVLCRRFCAAAGQVETLQGWLQGLIEALHALAPEARFRVRLERLRGPGCSRLHVDQLALRLLCTLHGPGTEWWPAPVPDRERLLRPGEPQAPPPRPLPRLPTGLPALLRGERFPLLPGAGVVHRSPAPDGETRVLLAIDVQL